jgi:hypothetical protein
MLSGELSGAQEPVERRREVRTLTQLAVPTIRTNLHANQPTREGISTQDEQDATEILRRTLQLMINLFHAKHNAATLRERERESL